MSRKDPIDDNNFNKKYFKTSEANFKKYADLLSKISDMFMILKNSNDIVDRHIYK